MDSKLILTPSHFFQYATQTLWVWYDLFGDQTRKGSISEFTLKLMEGGVLHENDYIAELDVSSVENLENEEAIASTLELMQKGANLIYQGCIQIEENGVTYRGRPDLLEKRDGPSIFGDWHYAPIEIKWSSKIKPTYKHQLIFYSMLLEKLQGKYPIELSVINRHRIRLPLMAQDKDIEETQNLIDQILLVMKGKKPELYITSKSKDSPWFMVALAEAEKNQDVSLIYKLDSRSVSALRKTGISTLKQMANADLRLLPKIPYASLETLERAKLQSQSLLEKKTIPIGKLENLLEAQLNLYFDIEGDPILGLDYLFGVWVTGDKEHRYAKAENVRVFDDGKYFVYFLAKRPKEEESMWKAFLNWLACLPEEFVVYHYASYEKTHLNSLSEKYSGSPSLELYQTKLVDLQKVIEQAIIFPLYFYSIKDIAKSSFLNFKWRHEKAGGAQSMFWYAQWLETGNQEILGDIINYNEDDVRATEALHIWLKSQTN